VSEKVDRLKSEVRRMVIKIKSHRVSRAVPFDAVP
jgi:hypothetical protein